MLHFLYRYLVLHDQAGIPGVGSFYIQHTPATISNNVVHASQKQIVFSPGSALTDRQFYSFLANESGLTEVDAVRKLQDFAYQLRKDIQTHPQVALTGFGVLRKNGTGGISFEPSVSADAYYPAISLTEVDTEPAENNTYEEDTVNGIEVYAEEAFVKKDPWRIWALVLALLALAAIGYFYVNGEIL